MNKIKQVLKTIVSIPVWLWKFLKNPFDTAQTSAYFLLILGSGSATVGYLQQYVYSDWLNILDNPIADFYANASAELISIAITVLIIERASGKQNEQEKKEQLIFQMGSDESITSKEAARLLRHKGWLQDGSLEGAWLNRANLKGAFLRNANLEGARLHNANLKGADLKTAYLEGAGLGSANLQSARLSEANLVEANLGRANLPGASLYQANLSGARLERANLELASLESANLQSAGLESANLEHANLSEANLQSAWLGRANLAGARLSEANLKGAKLYNANLKHANMYGVKCDKEITLPDGTKWTADTDWTKFGAVVIEDEDEWEAYRKEHGLLDRDDYSTGTHRQGIFIP